MSCVSSDFEVKNGILGMMRDLVFRLCHVIEMKQGITFESADKKIRQLMGICQEQRVWKNHAYFIHDRVEFAMTHVSDVKLNFVVVGNGGVGKTCFINCYVQKIFFENYLPTILDGGEKSMYVNGKTILIQLWDTCGSECYEPYHILSFSNPEVIIVCFSVVDKSSFQNVETYWVPEIRACLSSVPIMLVGTKADLRHDLKMIQLYEYNFVEATEAEALVQRLNLIGYVECSAKLQQNIDRVVEYAALYHSLQNRKAGKSAH